MPQPHANLPSWSRRFARSPLGAWLRRHWALVPCTLLLWAIHQPLAHAETEPIQIEYSAARGCPSAAEFQRRVFERTANARLASASETARVFSVRLERRAGRITGSLVIRERDGNSVARRVSGDSCDEIAMVLALASALAIDPRAELAPQQELEGDDDPNDTDEAPTPRTSSRGPEPRADDGRDAEEERPDDSSASYDASYERYPTPPTAPPREWTIGGALGPRLASGVGPRASLGAGVLVLAAAGAQPAPVSFGVELALLQSLPERVETAAADFRFLLARPQLCPLPIPLGARALVGPCGALELGLVTGQGSEIAYANTSHKLWAAGELLGRLDVALSDPLFLQVDVGVLLPVTRYRFVFEEPVTTVHPVPAAAFAAALRLGARY